MCVIYVHTQTQTHNYDITILFLEVCACACACVHVSDLHDKTGMYVTFTSMNKSSLVDNRLTRVRSMSKNNTTKYYQFDMPRTSNWN